MNDFDLFKNHLVKASSLFEIREIDKPTSYDFVRRYHYLGEAKFFCVQAFGLFYRKTNELVGCATFSLPQGGYALKGWFGLDNQTKDIYELSRLCLLPSLNGTNATSFLLGGSIRILKKQKYVRAIITLADSSRHVGSIYQICNFKYYGLTPQKNIFYTSEGKKNPRITGKKGIRGVWIPMSQKHRYAYLIDTNLQILHTEQPKPKQTDYEENAQCIGCSGSKFVYDRRFNDYYTCPYCTGKLELINTLSSSTG